MTNGAASPSSGPSALHKIAGGMLLVPLMIVVLGALALATQGVLENVRFARATQQLLRVVSAAHDLAGRQSTFAMQPGEDLLAALAHTGQITLSDDGSPAKLINPWQGAVHGTAAAPSILRIETSVPVRGCSRLALFFAQAASDLGLAAMEAEAQGGSWRALYKETDNAPPTEAAIAAACGQGANATLALAFRLR